MENNYQDKLEEQLRNINNLMFTFEVAKCCGYSTFITVYKNQTLIDLFSNIIHHFGNLNIYELFFITPLNEKIQIPISNQTVSDFVKTNIICNPIKLCPLYSLPRPVIYKIYLDDRHCNEDHCSLIHYNR